MKIIQIIPCSQPLYARFKDKDRGDFFSTPVVCLALVEDDDGYRDVIGMEACEESITLVTGNGNFNDYSFSSWPSDIPTIIHETKCQPPIKMDET